MKKLFKIFKKPLNKQSFAIILSGLGLLVVVTYGAYKFQQLVSPENLINSGGVLYGLKVSDRQTKSNSGNPLPNSMVNTAVPYYDYEPTIDGPTKLKRSTDNKGFNMSRIQGVIYYYER